MNDHSTHTHNAAASQKRQIDDPNDHVLLKLDNKANIKLVLSIAWPFLGPHRRFRARSQAPVAQPRPSASSVSAASPSRARPRRRHVSTPPHPTGRWWARALRISRLWPPRPPHHDAATQATTAPRLYTAGFLRPQENHLAAPTKLVAWRRWGSAAPWRRRRRRPRAGGGRSGPSSPCRPP
jgi:hypothetical protein